MSEFEKKSQEVLGSLQRNLSRIISCFGDPSVVRPVDLRNLLGADMNLAWKVNRLVNTADLFSLGKYLPGVKALKNFAVLAEKAGVPDRDTNALRESCSELEWLVRSYAGSRKELEIMLAGLSTEERTGNDSLHRSRSFQGNSYTFGMQSEVQLATNILMISDKKPGTVDICRIRGSIGLSRTRPEVPWRVSGTSILDARGRVKNSTAKEFLSTPPPGEPPILREFSSPDLPEFGSVTDSQGRTSYFLKGTEIGLKSAISLFTGEIIRNSGPLYGSRTGDGVALNNSSRTPSKRFTVEVYLPEEFQGRSMETEMWSLLFPSANHTGMTPGDRLPLTEQPMIYDAGRSPVPLAGVPVYSKMISWCFQRIGKDIHKHRLVRLSVEYPPIPASIDVLLELPLKK